MKAMNKGLRADNSTGFKGVIRNRSKAGGYRARVQAQTGKGDSRRVFTVWSGVYETAQEAAHEYDDAVRTLYGVEVPRFNFPKPGEAGLDGVRRSA